MLERRPIPKALYAERFEQEYQTLAQHPSVDRYRPRYLGTGSEHLVFSVEGHPDIVAKVNRFSIEAILKTNHDAGRVWTDLPAETEKLLRERLRKEEQALSQLRRFFGDAVLREKRFLQQVPLTRSLLQDFSTNASWFDTFPEQMLPVWGVVRVQERLPSEALDDRSSVEIRMRYPELDQKLDQHQLEEWTEDLLDGNGEDASVFLERLCESFRVIRPLNQADPAFKGALKAFVRSAIQFTEETGEVLDLLGKQNTLLVLSEGTWRLLLPDALSQSRTGWSRAIPIAERFLQGESIRPAQASTLLNAVHYARFVNALAAMSGVPERLRLSSVSFGPHVQKLIRLQKHILQR